MPIRQASYRQLLGFPNFALLPHSPLSWMTSKAATFKSTRIRPSWQLDVSSDNVFHDSPLGRRSSFRPSSVKVPREQSALRDTVYFLYDSSLEKTSGH
jgi:hypothetical protein